MANNRDFAALDWLIGEITDTLTDARHALEHFVETPADVTRLSFCLTHIHQVRGSLQMVQFEGATLLALEMEAVTQALLDNRIKHLDDAHEVLMRAILQFPLYLAQVRQSRQDNPLAILPLLNDLRAVRGEPLFSGSKLFKPDLRAAQRITSVPALDMDDAQFIAMAQKLRQMYQYAASGFIRDVNPEENLAYLEKVFIRLQKLTAGSARYALWDISLAVVEAMMNGTLQVSAALKNLLRQLDREIKALIEQGPAALAHPSPDELLSGLLYYIACAAKGTPAPAADSAVMRIYDAFELAAAMVEGAENDGADMINAPDQDAINQVVRALKDELSQVKAALDATLIGVGDPLALEEIAPTLKRIGDTLAVLGHSDLRQQVLAERERLLTVQDTGLDQPLLMAIAESLINLELALDGLIGQQRFNGTQPNNLTLSLARDSVLRESRNVLEQAKGAIVEYIASQWNSEFIAHVPRYLRETRGSLTMMQLERPARVLDACAQFIEEQLSSHATPEWQRLDYLADAITGVDYYLDKISKQEPDHDSEQLLTMAEAAVADLGLRAAHTPADDQAEALASAISWGETIDLPEANNEQPETLTDSPEMLAASSQISGDVSQTILDASQTAQTPEAADPVALAPVAAPPSAGVIDRDNGEIDDEIIDIFLEEAEECLDTINVNFPLWAADFDDQGALHEVRRAFHTIKGSGRMVGANTLGELAWSIENLLNRIIENSIEPRGIHVQVIDRVRALVGDFISAFATRADNPHPQASTHLSDTARLLAQGKLPASWDVSIDFNPYNADSGPRDVAEQDPQKQLWEIFGSEAQVHLATVAEFIAQMTQSAPVYAVPSDATQRALHTLKGSAHMAGVLQVAELVTPLERFVKELRAYQVRINGDILQLLQDCVDYTHTALGQIRAYQPVEIPQLALFIARVAELHDLQVAPLIIQQESATEHKIDPELLQVFMAEEMDLLLDADASLYQWRDQPEQIALVAPIATELSALHHAAQKAHLPALAAHAAALELIYQQLLAAPHHPSLELTDALIDAHETLLEKINILAAGQTLTDTPEQIHQHLREDFKALLSAARLPDAPTPEDSAPTLELDPPLDLEPERDVEPPLDLEPQPNLAAQLEATPPLNVAPQTDSATQIDVAPQVDAAPLPETMPATADAEIDMPTLATAVWQPEPLALNQMLQEDPLQSIDAMENHADFAALQLNAMLQNAPDDALGGRLTPADTLADALIAVADSDMLAEMDLHTAEAFAAEAIEPVPLALAEDEGIALGTDAFDSNALDALALSDASDAQDARDLDLLNIETDTAPEDELIALTALDLDADLAPEQALIDIPMLEVTASDAVMLEDIATAPLIEAPETEASLPLAQRDDEYHIEAALPETPASAPWITEGKLDLATLNDLTLFDEAEVEVEVEAEAEVEVEAEAEAEAEAEIAIDAPQVIEAIDDVSLLEIDDTVPLLDDADALEMALLSLAQDSEQAPAIDAFAPESQPLADTETEMAQFAVLELDDAAASAVEIDNFTEMSELDELAAAAFEDAQAHSQLRAQQLDTSASVAPLQAPDAHLAAIEFLDEATLLAQDGEILEIFAEEATELLDEIERVMSQWEAAPRDPGAIDELCRHLHTFKGGARLAGLSQLGDISHDFESQLTALDGASVTVAQIAPFYRYQDQLRRLVEQTHAFLANGYIPAVLSEAPGHEATIDFDDDGDLAAALDLLVDPAAIAAESGLADVTLDGLYNNVELLLAPAASSRVAAFDFDNYDEDAEFADVDLDAIPLLDASDALSTPEAVALDGEATPDADAIATGVNSSDGVAGLMVAPLQAQPTLATFAPKLREQAPALPVIPGHEFITAQLRDDQSQVHLAARRNGPQEVVKVSAELLEELVNLAGETSISRGRMEQQVSDFKLAIGEMDSTILRLHEQLRRLDRETEAQVLFRQEQMARTDGFDPLEMDRYSQLQQLSRSLIESASDLMDLKATLADKTRDAETVLVQQARITTDLQEGLMRSRMVPFSRLLPRLRRIVRQAASELNKEVELEFDNVEGELDKNMLERMVAPLEHMLRNAVDHGIELPSERLAKAKAGGGRIELSLARESGDVVIRLRDDGRGINLQRVRAKAIEQGLVAADAVLSEQDILQFILHPGFSTADTVTQISGRGVGMDVVHAEIKQLGGSLDIATSAGQGTLFTVRLPFTLSVNRALMVQIGDDTYALPLNTIEGITRIAPAQLQALYMDANARFDYAGEPYQVHYMGTLLQSDALPKLEGHDVPLPVVLVRNSESTVALQVDRLLGSREIVVKTLGPQFSSVTGVSGATIMGDGTVVVILDVHALIRKYITLGAQLLGVDDLPMLTSTVDLQERIAMVVDDSVTVRKVTSRFLEREGFRVLTAKDGIEALQILQDHLPHILLLDIEMPRMDGFEVMKNLRTSPRLQHLPVIMITSRTGDKHRERALSLGVNRYLGKPYQEETLLKTISELLLTSPEACPS